MLLLTRKKGETITIGKSVSVQIIEFGRGTVTLGIVAPKNVPVHRKEVFDSIVEQNKQSVNTDISQIKEMLGKTKLVLKKEK